MISHVWFVTFVCTARYSGRSEFLIIGEQLSTGQTKHGGNMADGIDRLKVLMNSSTPIVVMETSEEMRAVSLVRSACSALNMATFEWSIADGLVRSGNNVPADHAG